MNEILINSLAVRINIAMMTLEQVPPIYREAVQAKLDEKEADKIVEEDSTEV